ncbi:hypothetical protein KIPB_011214, partial [Kipferlia bialata]
ASGSTVGNPSAALKAMVGDDIEIVDCEGKHILPGGIDPHVHLNYPQGGNAIYSADNWTTGTRAALMGGTTSVIDFIEPKPDTEG